MEKFFKLIDQAIIPDKVREARLIKKSDTLLKKGNLTEAIECLDEVLQLNPCSEEALNNKGVILHQMCKYDEAVRCFDKILERKKNYYRAWNNRGHALIYLGKYDEAVECFNEVLIIKPDNVLALNNKGYALNKLKKWDLAIDSFQKALKLKPNFECALNGEAVAYNNMGNYVGAIKCLDKALKINPDYYKAGTNKGISLYKQKKYRLALFEFDNALKINPDYNEALEYKALVEDEMNRRQINANGSGRSNIEYDIFISYSWKQKQQAEKLFDLLTNNGLSCWMDKNKLEAGDRLFQELADAIYSSSLVIFCLSSDYLSSRNCLREFDFAMQHNKKYIPLLFCKDKKKEFGQWPSTHSVFFTMGNTIYNAELFKHLEKNDPMTNNDVFDTFIQQVSNKIHMN